MTYESEGYARPFGPPQHEPEVRKAKPKNEWGKIAKGVVAIFVLGLMLGSCVAGFMLPIKAIGWLFG